MITTHAGNFSFPGVSSINNVHICDSENKLKITY